MITIDLCIRRVCILAVQYIISYMGYSLATLMTVLEPAFLQQALSQKSRVLRSESQRRACMCKMHKIFSCWSSTSSHKSYFTFVITAALLSAVTTTGNSSSSWANVSLWRRIMLIVAGVSTIKPEKKCAQYRWCWHRKPEKDSVHHLVPLSFSEKSKTWFPAHHHIIDIRRNAMKSTTSGILPLAQD